MGGTLVGVITPGQSGLGSNDNKGYSTFPKAPQLEPNHQMCFIVIHGTLTEILTPTHECNRCILQPQQIGNLN